MRRNELKEFFQFTRCLVQKTLARIGIVVALLCGFLHQLDGQVYSEPYVKASTQAFVAFAGGLPSPPGDNQDTGYLFFTAFGASPIVAEVTALAEADATDATTGVRLTGRAESFCEVQPGLLRIKASALSTKQGENYPEFDAEAGVDDWVLGPSGPGSRFLDTITIRGGVEGTPVEVKVMVVFEGTSSREGDRASSSFAALDCFARLDVRSTASGGVNLLHYGGAGTDIPFSYSEAFVTTPSVGVPFQISGEIRAEVRALQTAPGTSRSIIEAMNTGKVFLSVPEGYVIDTASGHDYAPRMDPLPEPEPVADPKPAIRILQPVGRELEDGAVVVDFGAARTRSEGRPRKRIFTIRNDGDASLDLRRIAKAGKHRRDFIISGFRPRALGPGKSTNFSVTFRPRSTGDKQAMISIRSNDSELSSFRVRLRGRGIR